MYDGLVNISKKINDFKVYNSFTNFVFVKTPFGKDLWEYLKSKSIVIRYMGDYIRITAGTNYEVDETLKAINEYITTR